MMNLFIFFLILLLIAYVFIVGYLSRGLNHLEDNHLSDKKPKVSVIVCAHNEEDNIAACLESLLSQNYLKKNLEFLIVDDRSTDNTAQIIDDYRKKDERIKKITMSDIVEDFAPKKRAIDTAIKSAEGEIILLTDADGRPSDKWVSEMVTHFAENTDMVIGYAPYNIEPEYSIPKKLLALEYLSHASVAAASTGIGMPLTCVGTNMGYRKKLYDDVGGFGEYKNILSGDDDLFLTRVREFNRYSIKYVKAKEAQVKNDPPNTIEKFVHQRMRYASKGLIYPQNITVGLVSYFIFNLLLLSGLFFGLFSLNLFRYALSAFIIKGLVDFLFMKKASTTLHDQRSMDVFLIGEILHVPYVVLFGILGQLKSFNWGGTKSDTVL
jgi:cellulose synthase/poly-beta-1,6-N-acetylglucosamine synthase-like glycosyltransferase